MRIRFNKTRLFMTIIRIMIFLYLVFLFVSLEKVFNKGNSKKEDKYEEKAVAKKTVCRNLLHQGVNSDSGKGVCKNFNIVFKEDL